MIIAIKTDQPVTELILLEKDGRVAARDEWESGRQLSVQLMSHIETLLRQSRQSWNNVTGLIVFRGPGSFTGLRIGATVANTIAYAQHIPIVGTLGEDWVSDGVQKLADGGNDTQVVPHYGAEANITKPGKGSRTA